MPTESIDLLSKGKLYPGEIASLTFRDMRFPEFAILATGGDETKAVIDVLRGCLQDPKDFMVEDMIQPDMAWCMLFLRSISISPFIKWEANCPKCGDPLAEVPDKPIELVKRFPDDFNIDPEMDDIKASFEITVGDSVLEMTHPRLGTSLNHEKNVKANPQLYKGMDKMSPLFARRIKSVNGKPITYPEALTMIRKFNYAKSHDFVLDVKDSSISRVISVKADCPHCGSAVNIVVEAMVQFFRPEGSRFRDAGEDVREQV